MSYVLEHILAAGHRSLPEGSGSVRHTERAWLASNLGPIPKPGQWYGGFLIDSDVHHGSDERIEGARRPAPLNPPELRFLTSPWHPCHVGERCIVHA